MKPIILSLTTLVRGEELARCPVPDFSLAPAGASAGQPVRGQLASQVTRLTERVIEILKRESVETSLSPIQLRLRISQAMVTTDDEAEAVVILIPVQPGPTSPAPPFPSTIPVSELRKDEQTVAEHAPPALPEKGAPSLAPSSPDAAVQLLEGIFDLTVVPEKEI